jgi:hypothetical protein
MLEAIRLAWGNRLFNGEILLLAQKAQEIGHATSLS